MAPAARLVKSCRFSRVPITIHEKRMPRPMTRILLFASTALLAACATAQDIAPVETASTAPPAEATPAVPAEDSAELAAFFEAYDQAQLELSPPSKAYPGIVDEDYGTWGAFTDAAAVTEHEPALPHLAAMQAHFDRPALERKRN